MTEKIPPMPAWPKWDAPNHEWRAYRRKYRRWKRTCRRIRLASGQPARWVRVSRRLFELLGNPLVRAALAAKIKELR